MKGDFSRQTFDRARHFSGVRLQQGRVALDADWNEQLDLATYRVEREAADLIGGCGIPLVAAGFGLVFDVSTLSPTELSKVSAKFGSGFSLASGDFLISPGRAYVDGVLCENDEYELYSDQADLPNLSKLGLAAGAHAVFLDVWQRHLTAIEDPRIRETALGGPDTATRTRTVWQVRTTDESGPVNCAVDPPAYQAQITPASGRLRARALPEAATLDDCIIPAAAGYRGLENQLYRVEIAQGGNAYDVAAAANETALTAFPAADKVTYAGGTWNVGQAVEIVRAGGDAMRGELAVVAAVDTSQKTLTLNVPLALDASQSPRMRPAGATYMWSRDNGIVVARIVRVTGATLEIDTPLDDPVLGLSPGDWVSINDRARELAGQPPVLARVEAKTGTTITLAAAPGWPGNLNSVPADDELLLRRWDGVGAVKTKPPAPHDGFVELEKGLQIRFETGNYASGDYWQIAARTANADARSGRIEWPVEDENDPNSAPAALSPAGIAHHFCRLGILRSDGSKFSYEDCRPLFPPMTALRSLRYVGGDGQEAMPNSQLRQPLTVAVFNGEYPVTGATVAFTTIAGGRLGPGPGVGAGAMWSALTDEHGMARAVWRLDPNTATAGTLSQQAEARLLDGAGMPTEQVVRFSASHSIARQVAYQWPAGCTDRGQVQTVAEALDVLCGDDQDCCELTLGPDDDLAERIREHLEKDGAVCVCLKPGTYRIALALDADLGKPFSLNIRGCANATILELEAPLLVSGLASLTLTDLEIRTEGFDEPAVVFKRCREITLDDCAISTVRGVAVWVEALERLRLSRSTVRSSSGDKSAHLPAIEKLLALDSFAFEQEVVAQAEALAAGSPAKRKNLAKTILAFDGAMTGPEKVSYEHLAKELGLPEPAPAALIAGFRGVREAALGAAFGVGLVIDNGMAETWLIDNQLPGVTSIYGAPGDPLTQQDLLALSDVQQGDKVSVPLRGRSLHMRDNTLGRLTIGADLTEQLRAAIGKAGAVLEAPTFAFANCTGNAIAGGGNLLVASGAALATNEFTGGAQLGGLVAENASLAGNLARDIKDQFVSVAHVTQEAANVLQIAHS